MRIKQPIQTFKEAGFDYISYINATMKTLLFYLLLLSALYSCNRQSDHTKDTDTFKAANQIIALDNNDIMRQLQKLSETDPAKVTPYLNRADTIYKTLNAILNTDTTGPGYIDSNYSNALQFILTTCPHDSAALNAHYLSVGLLPASESVSYPHAANKLLCLMHGALKVTYEKIGASICGWGSIDLPSVATTCGDTTTIFIERIKYESAVTITYLEEQNEHKKLPVYEINYTRSFVLIKTAKLSPGVYNLSGDIAIPEHPAEHRLLYSRLEVK